MQAPPVEHLVVGAQFEPMGFAREIILEDERKSEIGKPGGTGRRAAYSIVIIVERGDRSGDGSAELRAIAEFVCDHDFRIKVGPAVQNTLRERRGQARRLTQIAVDAG